MKFKSVFDIIGPVMIGPSSSHTAGAARIGRVARDLFGRQPSWAKIHLYGSFAETFKGHSTDVAIVGGLLDYDTFDERIKTAFEEAEKLGMSYEFIPETGNVDHPNTARIVIGDEKSEMSMMGISIGGGKIEITELNGFPLRLSGNHPAILVVHDDRSGCIASVANCLYKYDINIGHMEVSRKERGDMALMVIEVDQTVDVEVMGELRELPNITQVTRIAD
ncbi:MULTISPECIES: L-serine ammonia-lyase, iron-sulfur-dependent subunit beta [unclassified Planococcus (in: firmicutes)]|uniref:L-serine ammonia-lyase, iron-sulfur-dependent subunit beta n=1 Tax=unclassified Planococcus (in: firmicutes) TaxID=2662419 RepID=UPI000C323245|nr:MULTISPECIES: L-serine ammonia-lyase, iron-sulfur-dependent subunit beta [unclassified Planococcus (in: firmicutes)]AUD14121.1 L-serine ammonia-lyase, iron-sulfur-dependent, subunit beta [Planococcus sp. MB-3u-03]PKG48143.1 L-serine ammonia-lyase, iron-sulfur-dependent, subunit beta [Planococcus sp. Urea-trap-24]PKG91991.1 L-serine ammonia-lyase, iron-sulfur-dependent, subunit beta [Planococcus sp. Urea-3u-39]PKH43105.1 L-serine ammonia-lyase, iron-sulfur-dependent, subunit beta [Planococcus